MNSEVSDSIATTCAGCGLPMDSDLPMWMGTVNLHSDTLFIGGYVTEFGESICELDVAFDWCDINCFGRWMMRAVVHMQARPRP